ncbi:MAG: helix-turn-helix domain-containing protein, partial [Pseudomonadota bacterium]
AGDVITPGDLPLEIRPDQEAAATELPRDLSLNDALEDLERRMIVRALNEAGGVAAHAAEALGLTKSNLAYKLKKYELG